MREDRRPVRKFPKEWFAVEDFTPSGGGEPREDTFSRPTHAAYLLSGIRQARLSKPRDALVPDNHIYFAARTWKDRPSLRRNLDNVRARVHRVLPDGAVVGSWSSLAEYEETKSYVQLYGAKQTMTADLDFVESIKGLDHKDKLGRSLLTALEEQNKKVKGLLEIVFYPDYTEREIHRILKAIRDEFTSKGLVFQKLITGVGRFSSVWKGPLILSEEIARRTEAVALVEQAGELSPAALKQKKAPEPKLVVAIRPHLPEVGVLDTGIQANHPMLSGVVLTGDPGIDYIDHLQDGGHGTFVAGVLAYGEDPEAQIADKTLLPRALVHSRKVVFPGIPGGINLDNYQELATTVEALRNRTRVFTASLSTTVPIDSDNISLLALNIDLIAKKYGVLFVLPTGNLPNFRGSGLSLDQPDFRNPSTWFSDPNSQMGRPGESFNAMTVSSYAERQVGSEYAEPGEINVYSRRGPGPKAMPKPDVAEAGGNCVLLVDPNDPMAVDMQTDDEPGASITNLRAPAGTSKAFGTSFAVPKIAFSLARLIKTFESLGQDKYAPLLAKGYLTHICRYPAGAGPFPGSWTEEEKRQNLHLLYGHGIPEPAAMDGVLPSELCFYAATEIERRQRHIYGLKFPTDLLNHLPDVKLRVTLAYFTKVDPTALDAELYSLVDLSGLVRWGGKTLPKISRGGPLTDYYPLKSFEVKFSKPREGSAKDKGQPTVEVTLRDRVTDEDKFNQPYAIVISLISPTGELLINDLVQEIETE